MYIDFGGLAFIHLIFLISSNVHLNEAKKGLDDFPKIEPNPGQIRPNSKRDDNKDVEVYTAVLPEWYKK